MDKIEIIKELHLRLDPRKRQRPDIEKALSTRFVHLENVPTIECADGFLMSVQASEFHYCQPRDSYGPWHSVEVGFPSAKVDAFMPYIDGEDSKPTETVYGYVPIGVVADAIVEHGGFAVAKATA